MNDISALRALRLAFWKRDGDPGDPGDAFPEMVQTVREAYPNMEPSRAFRDALHARLLAEAAWLKDHPVETPREAALKRSALVAAALLLLGLAALAWRSHRTQTAPAD